MTTKWTKSWDIMRDVMFGHSLWLSAAEQSVLIFIYKRTRFYGDDKEWEKIPYKHFLGGVWNTIRGCVCSRVVMGEQKLTQTLIHLERKRIIQVRRRRLPSGEKETNEYRIREDAEIDVASIVRYVSEHQFDHLKVVKRELDLNIGRLPQEYIGALANINEILEDKERRRLIEVNQRRTEINQLRTNALNSTEAEDRVAAFFRNSIRRNREMGTPYTEGRVPPSQGVGVPPSQGDTNIPSNNLPNFNMAAGGRNATEVKIKERFRILKLNK